jgi:hypothetical protein
LIIDHHGVARGWCLLQYVVHKVKSCCSLVSSSRWVSVGAVFVTVFHFGSGALRRLQHEIVRVDFTEASICLTCCTAQKARVRKSCVSGAAAEAASVTVGFVVARCTH